MEKEGRSRTGVWQALLRRWWIVALVTVVSVAAAWTLSLRQPRVYEASASLVAVPNHEVEDTSDILRSLDTLERRTILVTLARIPTARETRSAVAEKLGLGDEQYRYGIRGSSVPYTNIVRIDVEGPDPDRAAEIANAVADYTQRRARTLYRVYALRSFEKAVARHDPIRPDRNRNLLVGAVVGLVIGVGAVLMVVRRRASEQ